MIKVNGYNSCVVVYGAMVSGQKSFKLPWRSHQCCSGSKPMATCPECHVSYGSQLTISVIMGYTQISCIQRKAEENPGTISAMSPSIKAVRPVIALKLDLFLFIYKINVQPVFHHEVYHGRFTILVCLMSL